MSTAESYITKTELSLEQEFANIVELAGSEAGILDEQIEEGRQYKYRLEDVHAFKERLKALHVIPANPVEQTDYYFLYPNQAPDFLSETLCWREEHRFVDYNEQDQQELPSTGQLIYKTNPHVDGSDHQRTVRRVYLDNEEAQLQVLAKVKEIRQGNDFAPYAVSKRRTTYLLPTDSGGTDSIVIHIDEDVQLGERTSDSDYVAYYVGNFIEVTVPSQSQQRTERIKTMLGITGDSFDKPYIAKDAFIRQLNTTRPSVFNVNQNNAELAWLNVDHKPSYYDANHNKFMFGVDPTKTARLDGYEQSEVKKEIEQICGDLDQTDGGQDLPSRSAGGGGGSTTYERLTGHDGFVNYPTIRAAFDTATLYRKRWQPGDKRIVFSRVTFADEAKSKGVFIHFVGSHDAYERWLKRHVI